MVRRGLWGLARGSPRQVAALSATRSDGHVRALFGLQLSVCTIAVKINVKIDEAVASYYSVVDAETTSYRVVGFVLPRARARAQ